ncbi:uncharacterized protein [Apostichopus japonicus]|uniref:uncharacterized protein isoform X2 n=1 Tax=Stichopus japonicus TaxID=307972 RepID=UPI003AB87CB1
MATHEAYIEQHYHKYHNKHLTKSEILSTLSTFTDLRPKYDKFGSTYNIPICIWLFESHPCNPPMCYVRPTPMMMIKPSKHVDVNGRVYLPYLHEWKHPNCDLIGLIQVMMIIFGENSPVYSRPADQPRVMPQMTTPYPGLLPPSSQAPRPVQHLVNRDPSMGNWASSASVTKKETLLEERETVDISQKSTLAADYGRLMVNVADDLTLDSCLKLATLFRLPPAETDMLRRVSQTETSGITLLNFLQSRNIISMYDVTNLQEALLYIQLHRTNENLLAPYQSKLLASYHSKVEPFRFDGY